MRLTFSPHAHPESPISGSTVESMVDYAAKLGRTHFAYTDPAYMTSLFRAYTYIQKKYKDKMRFIPGLEIFFKDRLCEIIKGTGAEKAKYFKLTLYATSQEQFNKLSELVSREKSDYTTYYGESYPLWTWPDLQEAADAGLIACSSDVHDMVSKHLLTDTPKQGEQVLIKIKAMFGNRYFVSVIGNEISKTWVSLTEFQLKNGIKDIIGSKDPVHTNAARSARAEELVENPNKHRTLVSYNKNYITYTVDGAKGSEVVRAKNHEGFLPFPSGDVQLRANKFLFALAQKHSIKVLYSDYAFYAEKDDKIVQDVRLSQDNIKEHAYRHMQSSEEAAAYLNKLGLDEEQIASIESAHLEFAGLFSDFNLSFDYSIPEVEGGGVALNKCIEIIQKTGRMKDSQIYRERLKYEIEVLAKNGKVDLTPYFLPIRDVLDHYRENGRLVGPARGSAGGSLFMYLMGITHIDPIKYELSFERFLSLDRILTGNWPDVDVDLVDRELLVGPDGRSGYLYGRWGNKAAQISTRIQLRLKSAIRDVNRFLNGTIEPEIERLSKSLPPPPQGVSDKDYVFGFEDSDGNHIPGLIEVNTDLQKYTESRPREWEIVQKCLGISRQNSKHASAFVIADRPISQVVPTFMGNITQYEAKAVEDCKLIKYDFLIVNQLKDIEGCMRRVNKKAGVVLEAGNFRHMGQDLYVWDLPEEQEVMESVWDGNTETLFQINTQSMIPFVQKIKPKSIVDLATILALVRPGPLDFVDPETGLTMADEYIERRNNRGTLRVPELKELIPETFGVLVFQENTTKVAKQIGKMKPTDAEELRRVFSKKQKAKALAMKPLFMEGAIQTVGQEKAEMIWSQMETSSRYSFNCIGASQKIDTAYGPMSIDELFHTRQDVAVKTYDFSTDTFRYEKPIDKVVRGEREVWDLEMEDGTLISATPDHQFLTEEGWKSLQEILDYGLEILCE